MSSTPDPLLKLELQGSGEHPDTWGDNLNATIVLIGQAIAGRASIATTGGTTTLTDTQYATNQDRMAALDFSGVLASNAEIIVPARTKSWIVRNQCTGAYILTVKTSAGTGVVVSQGQVAVLWCDGTNVVSVSADATTLGGVAASSYARLDAANQFTKGNAHVFNSLVDGATITADASIGKVFAVTLGGNRTLALSNPVDGSEVELYVTQDGAGGRTLTLPGNVLNASGVTLAAGANAVTVLKFRYKSSLSSWYADAQVLVSGGSSTISDVTVAANQNNVDVFALAGQPSGAVTFTLTVDEGVLLSSATPGSPALDFSGFAASSVIAIVINGIVAGRGGDGGDGGGAGDVVSADAFWGATAGQPGGDAIRLPSTACTITINIGSTGRVWGGGGGGGGGGPSHNGDGASVGATGGGGGGGAGGGRGGMGGRIAGAQGNNGTAGSTGRSGTNGTGGTGSVSGGTGTAATGGNGGDFGSAGSSGTAATANTLDAPAGAGGAAGKAINYNGGSTPTYTGNTGSPYIKGATS